MGVKLIPALFILLQLLDIITTFIGMRMGLLELNPLSGTWRNMLITKGAVIIGVGAILQVKKTSRLDWILVILSAGVVLWNICAIISG